MAVREHAGLASGSRDSPLIWFDHQIFSFQRYGGVSRYFYELSKSINTRSDMRAHIFAPLHANAYLRKGDVGAGVRIYAPYPSRGLRFRPRLLTPILRMAMQVWRPDVLHETYYGLDHAHLARGQRVVTTIHDMVYEKFPGLLDRSDERIAMKYASIRRADQVICISDNTRKDLLDIYPEFEDKVSVVHHGVSYVEPCERSDLEFPEPYLLFVGTRSHYKNFERFIQAIGTSAFLRNNFGLTLFGGGELTSAERTMISAAGLPEQRVLQISGSDELLSLAYRRATAFVFPSEYEGFGMPLTEAMQHGCPVLCSGASCFPEICGDAAEYFDPSDLDDMRGVLERTLASQARLAELASAGARRGRDFSWNKCADETAEVYRKLL